MDVVNVVTFCLVIISDATNELPPGDNKDLFNEVHSWDMMHHFGIQSVRGVVGAGWRRALGMCPMLVRG